MVPVMSDMRRPAYELKGFYSVYKGVFFFEFSSNFTYFQIMLILRSSYQLMLYIIVDPISGVEEAQQILIPASTAFGFLMKADLLVIDKAGIYKYIISSHASSWRFCNIRLMHGVDRASSFSSSLLQKVHLIVNM